MVTSHSQMTIEAIPVSDASELAHRIDDKVEVVGVDEGQFFDLGLVEVLESLAAAGKQVIVAGLDTDYLRRPFEPIPTLAGRAEFVTKMLAVCHRCGGPGLVHADGSFAPTTWWCWGPRAPTKPAAGRATRPKKRSRRPWL